MAVLTYTGTRFEFFGRPSERDLPAEAQFHYDRFKKKWWTGQPELARKLIAYADERAQQALFIVDKSVEISRATDITDITTDEIKIPVPSGLSYLPFQQAGIAFCLMRLGYDLNRLKPGPQPTGHVWNGPRVALIADEMGLGKTVEAIGVINADSNIKRVLIICPASLRVNWMNELTRWCTRSFSGGFWLTDHFDNTDIVITNYDIIHKIRNKIDSKHWDLLICDEAHYIKTEEAKRTQSVLGYTWRGKVHQTPISADRKLFLTGSPILNRPIELFNICKAGDPSGLGANKFSFAMRYCNAFDGPRGWDFSGASNLDELQRRLRGTFMVRRLKRDVLKELPPKRRQVVVIPPDKAIQAIAQEREFFESNKNIIKDAAIQAGFAQAAGDAESYKEASKQMKSSHKVLFEQMAALRKATAIAKIPFIIKFLEDVLEQEDKIVFFAHHVDVLKQITEHFQRCSVLVYGGTKMEMRQAIVDEFQLNKKVKLFVGGITAAGIGFTLTAASHAIFGELDWRPSIVTQAEDRLHRIGQLESVLIQHILFDGSLDAVMVKDVIAKQEVIDKALDK